MLRGGDSVTEFGQDTIQEARETILEVMRGSGGRNAQARLAAAKMVLETTFVSHLTDEALIAEVRRRREARERDGARA